jgi:hypothetical protein
MPSTDSIYAYLSMRVVSGHWATIVESIDLLPWIGSMRKESDRSELQPRRASSSVKNAWVSISLRQYFYRVGVRYHDGLNC